MNPELSTNRSAGVTVDVSDTPISLRLPAGAAIFTVRGEAWITQERMADDIILGAGERFDVPNRELLVISATRGHATLFVAEPAMATRDAMRDVVDFARGHARRLRDEEVRHAMGALANAVQHLGERMRLLLAARRRAATH